MRGTRPCTTRSACPWCGRAKRRRPFPSWKRRRVSATANPRFAYVYAVALQDSGDHRGAMHVLEKTQANFPGDLEVLMLLVQLHRDAGDGDGARLWARKLAAAAPNVPAIQQFARSIEQGGK